MSNFYYLSAKLIGQSLSRARLPRINHAEIIDGRVHSDVININIKTEPPATMPVSLLIVVLFSVIDSIVDSKSPEFTNESFSKKYKSLPSDSRLEKVFRETYRSIKLFRNAVVHNKNKISIDESGFKINYYSNSTRFILTCGNSAVKELFSLCLLFIEHFDVSDEYFSIIAAHYFNNFLSGVNRFSDEIGDDLNSVNREDGFYANQRFRYRLSLNQVEINESFAKIERRNGVHSIYLEEKDEDVKYFNCDEYLIKDAAGKVYLVPGHKLDGDGRISLNEFYSWEVGENFFGKIGYN